MSSEITADSEGLEMSTIVEPQPKMEEQSETINRAEAQGQNLNMMDKNMVDYAKSLSKKFDGILPKIKETDERAQQTIVNMPTVEEAGTTKRWRWVWQTFMAVVALHLAYSSSFQLTFYHKKLDHGSTTLWDFTIGVVGMIDFVIQRSRSRIGRFLCICYIVGYFPWLFVFVGVRQFEVLIAFRIFFIVKVYHFLTTVKERISSNYMKSIVILIVKFMVLTMYWVHLVACIFFAVAMIWHNPSETWLGSLTIGKNFKTDSAWKNYTTCVYYSMTTVTTVGYGDIHPVNTLEMIVTTIVLLINLVVMAFVGSDFIDPLLTPIIQKMAGKK